MASTVDSVASTSAAATDRVLVVSADTHIGPLLQEQLRPYCPKRYLEAFDEFAGQARAAMRTMLGSDTTEEGRSASGGDMDRFRRNWQTAGHHDMHARLADLDRDGVAAEVIFFGSQNTEPMPFMSFFGPEDPELSKVGGHMYNQFLADACSIQPERQVGLAHVPITDLDAAVKETVWAHEHGLRGINFPCPRLDLPQYNDPCWEPLWSVCEDLDMPLCTHIGAGIPIRPTGVESMALMQIENGTIFGRRAVHYMVFGGVFERHPGLKLVLTEMPGDWWPAYLNELDSIYLSQRDVLCHKVPRLPSEYCMKHVFIGASFMAPFEAQAAVRDGYDSQLLWGSDYPHMEGTYQYPRSEDEEPMGRRALRYTFAGIPSDRARMMLGENAVRVYGLDAGKLAEVAQRVGPTLEELSTPLEQIPDDGGKLSFRRMGPWY